MADGTVFPSFLQLRHDPDNSGKAAFLRQVDSTLDAAESKFRQFSEEAARQVDRALSARRNSSGSLDLGGADLQAMAQAQQARAVAAREVATATHTAAKETGDYSRQARLAVAATEALAIEEEEAARAALAHASAVEQVQQVLNRQASSVSNLYGQYLHLAQAEASAANGARMLAAINLSTGLDRTTASARESAAAFELMFQAQDARRMVAGQAFFNTALGIDAATKSARDSAVAFTELYAAQERLALEQRQLHGDFTTLAQAEAAAADGARMLEGTYRGTSLELGRSAKSARESAAAFADLGHEQLRGTNANNLMVNSQRSVRIAGLQAGQQLTDIAVQMEMGTRATTIFSQQIPQLAFALSYLEGSANKTQDRIGKFATFLSGPWGAAFFIATAVLGPFISKMFDGADAADDLSKKNLSLTDALHKLKSSSDEALKALKAYNAEQERARDNAEDMIKINIKEAEHNLNIALALRERIRAEIELENRSNRGAVSGMAGSVAAAGSGAASANSAEIKALEQAMRNLHIEDATRDAKAAADPIQAINNKYDDMASAARRAAAGNDALSLSLEGTLTKFEIARKTAIDAQRATTRNNREFGREIDLAAARSIASGAGFNITSGHRDRSEQQALYNRWVAQGRPSDNPVAVPGTSAHERDNALDIGFGAGVTPASLRKAFQDEGVRLTKILKERGHFHIEWSTTGADKIAREAVQLQDFGEKAAESIARINEHFDEQPKLIDQAARSTRELDKIIKDLSDQKPVGFEQMIADAEAAKGTIEDALLRPFEDLNKESQRRVEIERLLTEGREKEAAVLQTIWQIEQQLGPLSSDQEAAVRGVVEAREDELEALRRLQEQQSNYLDATRAVRGELEAIFAGHGNLSNFGQIFRELKAKTTVDALFGDALRDLDKWVKASPLTDSVDYLAQETERAGGAALDFAAALSAATRMINPSHSEFDKAFGEDFWATLNPNGPQPEGQDIVVTGRRLEQGIAGMTPEAYFEQMARRIVGPLTEKLDSAFGTTFFSQLQGALSGALYGYATAGTTGAILGGTKGLLDKFGGDSKLASDLSDLLGQAMEGAQTGQFISGLGKSLGVNTSNTGGQIGGAIGQVAGTAIGGPAGGMIGSIIGSIQGAIIGGLIRGTKRGSALIGGGADGLGITGYYGNSSSRQDTAGGLAGSTIEALNRIAEQLGGQVNAALGRVSIGMREDSYRVDPTGKGITKTRNGAIDFGEDGEAAIAYAVRDLINDGVITGLRQSAMNLVKAGDDIEQAVQNALSFEDVFKRLKAIKDPQGAALDDLDAEFKRLQDLFTQASASTEEWNQLEELYWLERDKIVKEAMERSIGSLKSFLDELTVGNSALSLRDRKASALANYTPLAGRVAAGDSTAYDDFTDAARALLEIERQISGSQSGYFALLDQVTGLTQGAIGSAQGSTLSDRTSPFGERNAGLESAPVVDALAQVGDRIVAAINSQGDATQSNLGAVIANTRSTGSVSWGRLEAGW